MNADRASVTEDPLGAARSGPIAWCDTLLRLICAAMMLFIMALTLVDVFMRHWFSAPITGSAEMVMFAMAILIFSAFPTVTLHEQHISVSILRGRFGAVGAWLQRSFILVVSLLACAAMAWQLVRGGAQLTDEEQTTMVLELPLGALSTTMGILSAVSALALVYLLARHTAHGADTRRPS